MSTKEIFSIHDSVSFEKEALSVFKYQSKNNFVYNQFLKFLKVDTSLIKRSRQIPFLPIQFFKSHKVISTRIKDAHIFSSSGTSGAVTSKHYVPDLSIYEKSYLNGFEYFYGPVENYAVLGLLPSYLERKGSSLVYMVNDLIKRSKHPKSGFYLNNLENLLNTIFELESHHQKVGGINIIDLSNIYSCSFIATQDLGKTLQDGSFEVLGRFDNSDIRGCNLLIS
jgi:hypothetical protein